MASGMVGEREHTPDPLGARRSVGWVGRCAYWGVLGPRSRVFHLSKKPRTQGCDQRNLERVVAFLGATRDVATLSESDVRRYTMARRQGDPSLKGVTPGKPVRDRAIELDLVLLMTALNWAARERTSTGRRLLRENPRTGNRLPKGRNPERPVMSHDVYLKLLEVAPRVHSLLPLALIVAEGTGRRISAWRKLVW